MGVSSFEEAAREVRYSFLGEVSEATGLGIVALGHTFDDLAETVLMRIMRGSGTRGLRGMVDLSDWRSREGDKRATLFRPMLGVSKEEALAYCAEKNITCRRDTGNVLMRFTRNRVRHHLLPRDGRVQPPISRARWSGSPVSQPWRPITWSRRCRRCGNAWQRYGMAM